MFWAPSVPRGKPAGLVLGLVLLTGWTTGCSKSPDQSKGSEKSEPRQSVPAPVPLGSVDTDREKKEKARLGCRAIVDAIIAYHNSPQNPGVTDEEKLPSGVEDLVMPPFGGTSFLRNGEADTLDPWGKPYQFKPTMRHDGTTFILVKSLAPDGTSITQFGIGPESVPKFE